MILLALALYTTQQVEEEEVVVVDVKGHDLCYTIPDVCYFADGEISKSNVFT